MKDHQPYNMTTEERLDEIASIMATAIRRQKNRNKTKELRENFSGLPRQAKRPCHDLERKEQT